MGLTSQRPRLDALTSLRFFAALHVLLFHSLPYLGGVVAGHGWLRAVISTGPNSVGFFFVLSGFILAYTYLAPPEEGLLRPRSFWAARFARVYPVYLFGLIVAAPLMVVGFLRGGATPGWFALVGVTVPTLVQSWTPHFALVWNSPAWSLSVEAFFYLVFPFTAPLLWPLRRRGLFLSLLVFWSLAQLAPTLYSLAPAGGWLGGWQPSPSFWTAAMDTAPYVRWDNPWYALIQYNPLTRLPEFLFGIALGRLYLMESTPSRRPGLWSIGFCAAGVALFAALGLCPESLRISLFFHNGLLTPLYGVLIYSAARARRTGVVGVLSLGPLVILGEASYALYILHVPIKDLMEEATRVWAGGTVLAVPLFLTYAALAIASSVVVLRWVEQPGRRLLRTRLANS